MYSTTTRTGNASGIVIHFPVLFLVALADRNSFSFQLECLSPKPFELN